MSNTLTIDSTGRVVIPIRLRETLNLSSGDKLALECAGDTITLRPVRAESRLRKKRGIWVFAGDGEPLTSEMVRKVRDNMRDARSRRHWKP